MSEAEITEWQAYYQVEPFGSPADDDRTRTQLSLFFAANSDANASQPDWLDRTPEETARLRGMIISDDDDIDHAFANFNVVDEDPLVDEVSDPVDAIEAVEAPAKPNRHARSRS